MTILEYYKKQQLILSWKNDFEGSKKNSHAKVLPYTGTCFRNISSFFSQTKSIKPAIGKKREATIIIQKNGKVKDPHKQRIVGLESAKLLKRPNEIFQYTDKAKEVMRLDESNLTYNEKKIALMILLLDYNECEDLSIIKSALNIQMNLYNAGLSTEKQCNIIRKAIFIDNKYDLFKTDAFWLVTFSSDKEFVKLYINSSKKEKEELYDWVIKCSKKDKKDLIAYKYKPSGSYSLSTFTDDLQFVLSIYVLTTILDDDYKNYIKTISRIYPNCKSDNIINFIMQGEKHYIISYNNSIKYIKDNLEV